MYLLKSMLPYDASTEYTPMPSDAGQHRNQQQFWLSKAQAKDLYFYLLSSPMARHPHDKQIGIAVGCTSQIFSLGSPTIGERSGARRSMELAPSCDPTHGCRPDLLSGRDDDDQCRRTSGKRGAALRTSTTTRPMAPTVTREAREAEASGGGRMGCRRRPQSRSSGRR